MIAGPAAGSEVERAEGPEVDIIEVHVSCPDPETAGEIARAVVSERLAACANVTATVDSTYWWNGEVESEAEVVLVLKTRAGLFDLLSARVEELHPYDVPSILGHTIDRANPAYAAWVHDETIER